MSSSKPRRRKRIAAQAVAEAPLPRRQFWEWALLAAFLLLLGFDLAHHPMWRDEMQPWLFGRDSSSIPDLFRNLHYEDHPRLWYILLHLASLVTHNAEVVQALNFLVVGSAMFLFIRFCPAPFYLKALAVFGYYFVYEWGAISRNYGLGMLFCFAFCVLLPRRRKSYLELGALLFLATQSDDYAAILALGLVGFLILEALMNPEAREWARARKFEIAVCLLVIVAGALVSFWTGIPRPDATVTNLAVKRSFTINIINAFGALCDGFLPLPEPSLLGAWGWGMIGHTLLGPMVVHAVIGVFLFVATLLFFRRCRLVQLTYLGGALLLLLAAYAKAENYARHAGHFYLWFLICLWLARSVQGQGDSPESKPFHLSSIQLAFLCPLLVFLIGDTIFLSIAGYAYPFSRGRDVAEYIENNHLQDLPIFGYPDFTGIPVSGYLDRKMYYPDTHRWGSFVIETNKRETNWDENKIYQAIIDFAAQGHPDFLVVLDQPFLTERDGRIMELTHFGNLTKLVSMYPAMDGDEVYWLFRYTSPPPGS
jgi:hypothetical protein